MKKIFLFLSIAAVIVPAISSAHMPNILTGGYWGPLVSCNTPLELDANGAPIASSNPCTSLCNLVDTVMHTIAFAMSLTLYALAPVMFLWSGILILIAGANTTLIASARKLLTGTVVGVLITFSAFLLVETFVTTLGIGLTMFGFGTWFCVIN